MYPSECTDLYMQRCLLLTKLYLNRGFNFIRKLMSAIDLDLRHRSLILAKMELLPKLYGQDVSALFKQKYHGNVTIVPDMRVEDSLGIKAILQPSLEDMRIYIRLTSTRHL